MFNTVLQLLLDEGVGIFVSYSGGTDEQPVSFFRMFMDRYYPAAEEVSSPDVRSGGGDSAKLFAGEYHAARRSFTGPNAFLTLLEPVTVAADGDGHLAATPLGESDRYPPARPGVFTKVAHPYRARPPDQRRSWTRPPDPQRS